MVCSDFGSRSKIAKVARVHSRLNHVVNEGRLPPSFSPSFPPSFSPSFPPTPSQQQRRWSPTPSLALTGPLSLQRSLSSSTTLLEVVVKTHRTRTLRNQNHAHSERKDRTLAIFSKQQGHTFPTIMSLLLALSFEQKAWWVCMDTADLWI